MTRCAQSGTYIKRAFDIQPAPGAPLLGAPGTPRRVASGECRSTNSRCGACCSSPIAPRRSRVRWLRCFALDHARGVSARTASSPSSARSPRAGARCRPTNSRGSSPRAGSRRYAVTGAPSARPFQPFRASPRPFHAITAGASGAEVFHGRTTHARVSGLPALARASVGLLAPLRSETQRADGGFRGLARARACGLRVRVSGDEDPMSRARTHKEGLCSLSPSAVSRSCRGE